MNYTYDYDGIQLECLIEYTETVRGARDRLMGGLPLEPDYPASVELLEAKVGDVDVLPLIDPKIVENIEWEALQCLSQR